MKAYKVGVVTDILMLIIYFRFSSFVLSWSL